MAAIHDVILNNSIGRVDIQFGFKHLQPFDDGLLIHAQSISDLYNVLLPGEYSCSNFLIHLPMKSVLEPFSKLKRIVNKSFVCQ